MTVSLPNARQQVWVSRIIGDNHIKRRKTTLKQNPKVLSYVALEIASYIRTSALLNKSCTIRVMLGTFGFWAGGDLYYLISARTRDLGLLGLIRGATPLSRICYENGTEKLIPMICNVTASNLQEIVNF